MTIFIERMVNTLISVFLIELPSIIAIAYLVPAFKRAGRPKSARIAISVAAALAPMVGISFGFGVDGAATAMGRSISLEWLLAIGVIASSVVFTVALRLVSGARSLLFAGCAATLVVSLVIGAVLILGGDALAMIALLILFGLPFWHLTLGPWTYGWSHAERHRLIDINPTCLHCGYDLSGLPSRLCPECGRGPGA